MAEPMMSKPAGDRRRPGGREARRALRTAPLAEAIRPVRAGLEGGHYRPLSDAAVQKVHQTALRMLEEIGLADAPESGIEAMTAAGAILGDDGRLRFPPALVEDMLALAGRDTPDPTDLDLNTLYAVISGTSKHGGSSFTHYKRAEMGLEMLHMVAGSEEAWRARPFVSNSNCFVVPPMKFATESCLVMETLIRGGMPILLLSAGQAGATAPTPLAGAVTQAVAECLAGVVYVNAIKPGHPAIFGTWPFVSDLRTGAMSGGSAEQGLLTAACGQMARFYDLPGGSACGMSDSKAPDMQAGYERGISNVMAGLSGLNLI